PSTLEVIWPRLVASYAMDAESAQGSPDVIVRRRHTIHRTAAWGQECGTWYLDRVCVVNYQVDAAR
ncbi:MAG: hypothetical protein R6U98_35725, partial [Pirellulaceae bacterium]